MGKSLSIFSKRFGKHNIVRILLLGLDAAGKTTILYRLKLGIQKETVPTIGFNVEEIYHKNLNLHIWDVGGQDRLRPLWRPHYRGTSGIFFVVDSSDTSRIALAKKELHSLMKEEELKSACLCILANKQDLPGALSADKIKELLAVEDLEQAGFITTVVPGVASKGEGLEECVNWLATKIKPI